MNVRYLLPKYFFPKKQLLYVLTTVLLLTATVLVLYHEIFPWSEWFRFGPVSQGEEISERPSPLPGPSGVRWMRELTPLIIAFLGSTLVEITRFANVKEKEAIRSEKEKLETELKFLKSQVNPHFLFNALNNIYSLSVMQAPQTPESIMQLSEILRYMVYDSNEELVPLKSEINYIKNFVDLKLLKDSRGMDVQLQVPDTPPELRMAPLLFIPFVENAFKHSKIENLREGYIRIKLSVTDQALVLNVVNSIPENDFTKDEVGGVGLENIKKRLELLYPGDQHQLTIQQTNDRFNVNLRITL
jgi:LytS/YehU family sensor histidine kinase